jgi:hypothetical protein
VAFIFLYLCFILHFLLFNLIIFLTYGILWRSKIRRMRQRQRLYARKFKVSLG